MDEIRYNKAELRDYVTKQMPYIMSHFNDTGWEYLVKRVPLILDDKLSQVDKQSLDEHHSCSFANKYYVGFSEERFVDDYCTWCDEKKKQPSFWEIDRSVLNILTHEFGHLLLGHPYVTRMKGERNVNAQIITMEIETNRGVHDMSDWFAEIAMHDGQPNLAPTKTMLTHEGIFNKVKELLDNKNQLPDNDSQQQSSGNDDKNDDGNQNEQQPKSSDAGNESPGDNKDEQNASQGKRPKPDYVGAMKDTVLKDDGVGAQQDLLADLGLGCSTAFENATSVDEKVKVLGTLGESDDIRKTLAKIKGTLKGDLSRTKVSTYSRPSRKTSDDGLIKRGRKYGKDKAPRVLIALDESGSMDGTVVQTAATAVNILVKTLGRNSCDVHICKFNNWCSDPVPIRQASEVIDDYCPRGGTSFGSVCEHAKGYDVVLCIGDGEGRLPDEMEGTKWIDILITPFRSQIGHVKRGYYRTGLDEGRRETLWIGCDKRRIEKLLGDM